MAANHEEWSAMLARAKLGVGAAELHGSVCGYLCAGHGGRAHELLAALALEGETDGPDDDLCVLLDRAVGEIGAALRTGEAVEPLLPEASLAARANAAVDWCRGFLGGLGLTGVVDTRAQTPAVRELLADFGHVAATHLAVEDDDEAALDDVLAFLRSGMASLHTALAPASGPHAKSS
jgi:uncharacterized protein